jgi:phage/plasmid-like protein (TIGR03299 family)
MAANIDTSTGKAAVFVTGEPAWHRLGTVIDKAATSAEAIKLAGLDWTVEQWPLQASHPVGQKFGGRTVAVPNRVANVRTDTEAVLGVVSTTYNVFQNVDAFDFMDALVGDKLAMYETAGALDNGKRVWMSARVPGEFRVGKNDQIKPYVLLTNVHDGSGAMRMIPTTVRVVCQNTLNLALSGAGRGEGLSIWHLPKLDERVREAREKLGIIAKRFESFDTEVKALADKKLNEKQAMAYFESLLKMPADLSGKSEFEKLVGTDTKAAAKSERQLKADREIIDQWLSNWENEKNNLLGIRHTAWSAYNAVSEYADHQKKVSGKDDDSRDNNQLKSIWFGASNELKQDAYRAALALAK